MHLKEIVANSRRNSLITLQKREAQIKLPIANKYLQDQYKGFIPEDPHGTLPLSAALGAEKKLYAATFTSRPSKSLQKRSLSFLDENNKKKFFTIEQLSLADYEQMGGTDFVSSNEKKPYFGKATQEALRAELSRLKGEGA